MFTSFGYETGRKFSEEKLCGILSSLSDEEKYGMVLRAKGIVEAEDGGEWIHFDYVPNEPDVRRGPADISGRICVIGSGIDEQKIKTLLGI